VRHHTSKSGVAGRPGDNNPTGDEISDAAEVPNPEASGHASGDKESLDQYLHEISQWKLLSVEGERSLARLAAAGDQAAREEMVQRNLRLVVFWVKRYRASGVPIQDLVQEGNIGLMRAVEKFDPRKGTRFSTYASWWIRQALARAICDKQDIIRIPVHMHQKMSLINRMLDNTREPASGDVDIQTAVNGLGIIPYEEWERARRLQQSVSLDRRPDNDRDDPIDIVDQKAVTPVHGVYLREIKEHVSRLMKKLPRRHQAVLNLRFGLDCHGEHTLESIGARLHISRERVRQIQTEAIARLAEWTQSGAQSAAVARTAEGQTLLSQPRRFRDPRKTASKSPPALRAAAALGSRRSSGLM
jgi:RNA polymerase sigma factor (sigma-70 family)